MSLKAVEAYSVISVDSEARFLAKNFLDVTGQELVADTYDAMVLEGGSVDITNLNTI